ncbi:MAG TPA: tetratricopeptide repeat protein [Candidatus Acidoferrales bacterium]|nr:tetratricopeptide repeat protein [Candidatus Acidoferrales bacterium]
MALNKAKVMESALKSLNQGKVAQAIQEYQTILRSDPKDQVVLMTVGDLFVRQSNMAQAVEYFERLAQLYLNDGFNSKAIAIYKKISKLAPNETQPLEKLANLYVQQGILSEARPIFLQLAEAHLKANHTAKAVEVLRRLLEVEPDNPRVQRRLAELYMAMGQKKEAAQTYVHFARYLHEHGDATEAQKMVDAAIAAQPGDSAALLLKARILGAAGNSDGALDALVKLPEADRNSETLGLQIDLCLKGGKYETAIELLQGADLKGPEKYALISKVVNALIEARQEEQALELIGGIRESAIAAGNQEFLAKLLVSAAERIHDRLEPREWLVDLYRRTADNNLSEAQSQLADALISAGQLQRAEATLAEMLEREPDNEFARHRLTELKKQTGQVSETPTVLDETAFQQPSRGPLTAGAASENDAGLDEETQQFVSQALTDVDLFSSYGLSQKAVQLLETILQRVPQHAPTIERLLDLTLGTGDDRRTAELAAQLEQIYTQRGDAQNAERFTELRRRFQRASGATDAEIAAGSAPPPPVEAQKPAAAPEASHAAPSAATAPPEFAIPATEGAEAQKTPEVASATPAKEPEIDLSDEWESLASQTEEQPSASASASGLADAVSASEAETEMPEFDLELVAQTESGNNEASSTEALLDQLVAEVEGLGATPAEPAMAAPPAVAQSHAPIEAARETPEAVSTAPPAHAPANDQSRKAAGVTNDLSEVFQEFRAELGEMGEQERDEDLETHYNLGIAYREMGLLDEAIGEFQKVAKAVQDGRSFRYAMQCCTLLGLTFTDKSEPKIAALWYHRALELPGLEQETVIALRYDLGVAEEQAGDVDAALNSFRQVYAMNIDYRDVSERISALQKH